MYKMIEFAQRELSKKAVSRLLLVAICVVTFACAPGFAAEEASTSGSPKTKVKPAQFLASQPHPVFKPGNGLLPLTRWGWQLSFEAMLEMANWGYALDFGEVNEHSVKALESPDTIQAKIIALVRAEPNRYKLSVLMPRGPQDRGRPPAALIRDKNENVINPPHWSPEAPDSVLSSLAAQTTDLLHKVAEKAPITVILNGGERGLDVPAVIEPFASASPEVVAAKGSLTWSKYISKQKAHQEAYFTKAARSAAPDATYIFYPTGNQYSRATSERYDWDYRYMRSIVDYPSGSFYYKDFNSGWAKVFFGKSDILTQVLNAHAYDTALGERLAYHWLNAGYSSNPRDSSLGDIVLYYGFLKSAYTAGMLGGIAGYFAFPDGGFDPAFDPDRPPHWLQQIQTLGHVHAEFSYLEDMLREGDLLLGHSRDALNASLPAYEFPSGFSDIRVLVRKMGHQKRWLISAWAADGISRSVTVNIDGLAPARLHATPAGSLFDIRIVSGSQQVTPLDPGSTTPSPLHVPESVPDRD